MTSKFHYDPAKPSAFSTVEKLQATMKEGNRDDISAWLEKEDASQTGKKALSAQSVFGK